MRRNLLEGSVALAALVMALGTGTLRADTITVPNFSFESQSAADQPFGVNVNIDNWHKIAQPAYFDSVATNYGIFWEQTAGVFLDTNPYANHDGAQAAFMLSFPQVTLYQDLTAPDAKFQIGQSYNLTIGLFGKNMTAGSTLELSLYYRDAQNNMITVGSPTDIVYDPANFPLTSPLNLLDYSVNIGEVQAGDAWANQNIGIKIESVFGYGDGYWDLDNVRLTSVPEPGTVGLAALGLGGLALLKARSRRRA